MGVKKLIVKMGLKEDPEGFMARHVVEIAIEGDRDMLEFVKDAIEKAVEARNSENQAYGRWKLT